MKIEELIKNNDTQNQFQVLIDSYKQIENAWNNKIDLEDESKNEFNNIIVAGMGGSAISADLLKSFLGNELRIPLQVCRDYSLPYYANENSLVIISSYSGNTEETISCLEDAIHKQCKLIIVSTGGKVKTIAQENNIPWINLQKGFQPRYALGVGFFTLLKILQSLNIIPNQSEVVNKVKELWKNKGMEYSTAENSALTIAEELVGFIPLIYSSAGLEAVGYRLKCQFNENSKLHAYNNVIPELNHNEIIGWETFDDKQL
ncbi:MAG: bifunctional phosphoglucose/phosphomannose isomerase, partial [Bacteroidetes bacterium]|nr:bifunctional phosphoglucose/phosphomannose isomerase [Bacteroidota bacterium]